jgi:hypothetical protein
VSLWQRLARLWERTAPPVPSDGTLKEETARKGKRRLLVLLLLFDVLLIAVVLLSIQETELIEHEVTLLETREVIDLDIREQVITHTTVITEIIPYGSQQ